MSNYINTKIGCSIKSILSLVLTVAMVIVMINAGGSVNAQSEFGLQLNRDDSSDRFVISNTKGNEWYSYPYDIQDEIPLEIGNTARSNLEIDYIFKEEMLSDPKEYTANSYAESVMNGDYIIKDTVNGFRVTYTFTDLGFVIPVDFELKNGSFEASVKLSEIKEKGDAVLTSIKLLPYFASGNSGESGSIFVPDGSGALIHYNNGSSQQYEKEVYGTELAAPDELDSDVSENIKLPVFGSFKQTSGMLGIITSGSANSSIIAVSGDPSIGSFNLVYSKLNYRSVYNKVVMNSQNTASRVSDNFEGMKDYSVKYSMLSGSNIGIMDLAEEYRSYLIEECGIEKREYHPEFNINLIGAIDVKANFLGIPYRKTSALTTYDQAEEIVDYLKELGIGSISVKYSGWMKDGVSNNSLPTKVKYSGKLGSEKDFIKLGNKLSELGGTLYPEVDLLNYRSGSSAKAIRNAFREVAYQSVYMPSVYASRLDVPEWKVLSSDYLYSKAEKFFKSYAKSRFDNITLSGITDLPYSNLDSKHFVSAEQTVSNFKKTLQNMVELGITVTGNSSSDYALPYISKVFSAPQNMSNEKIMDERVPFYSLVLHGYISMTSASLTTVSDVEYSYLSAVENGYELMFIGMYSDSSAVKDTAYDKYFSAEYKFWAERAAEYYNEYYPLLEKIYDSEIAGYEKLDENINSVSYKNGITVYVNYGEHDATVNGVSVEARSFAYLKNE